MTKSLLFSGILALTGATVSHGASLLIYADGAANALHVATIIDNSTVLQDPIVRFDGALNTPDLFFLQNYESVLVWTNNDFDDATAMGNVLADYVDAGGGVVVATFGNTTGGLDGRFLSGGYHPVTPAAPASTSGLSMGTVNDPFHPVMLAVFSFGGGTGGFRSSGGAATGTSVIAEWSNGDPFIVERPQDSVDSGIVLGLNLYPVSSDQDPMGWDSGTDGAQLLGNALKFAGQIPEPSPALFLTMAVAIGFGRRHR
jgi:hypothetical protein